MANLIERHDRSRFEVFGYSFGPWVQDDMQRRLMKGFDQFHDVAQCSDQAVSLLARRHEIDIAIDLKGLTEDNRLAIFAIGLAPIQVSYLGFPGTSGTAFVDYLIADNVVLPPEHFEFYSEKVVHLPHSYQVNDSRHVSIHSTATRSKNGLPPAAFVFCCFNNSYKITPDLFDIWMRLLAAVDRSVLWLLEGNSVARRHLCDAAALRGINPARLIFAPRVEHDEHLARHRHADLFLDTFYYNAHTTASDALYAGLPVVTCLGDTFAGRVAASLLGAVGLPELITRSHEEYEALALRLATHPEELAALKDKLARNGRSTPLFDTALFTRHIEEAYLTMYQRHQQGLAPDHFAVAP